MLVGVVVCDGGRHGGDVSGGKFLVRSSGANEELEKVSVKEEKCRKQ